MVDKRNEDGMEVLTLTEMNRRFDKNGNELARRQLGNLEVVHAKQIAEYYGLDYADVGYGDNVQLGVWSLVHRNIIGQRVPFNNEETVECDLIKFDWEVIKDGTGKPIDTKEIRVEQKFQAETDDGMYVRLSDLKRYAKRQGWTKGGGWPAKNAPAAPTVDVAGIVAAVMAAMQAQPQPAAPVEEKQKRTLSPEHLAKLAAGREAKRAEREA